MRSPARSLPAAPARAWTRPGRRRPPRKNPLPFPLLLSPRITGSTVWERRRSIRIFKRGAGEARAAAAAQRKTKSASVRAASTRGCSREGPGRPDRDSLCSPPRARQGGRGPCGAGWDGEARKKVSRFLLLRSTRPPPSPPPVFWGLPLPLGKGLNGFASKDCIYTVLLREERKHTQAGRTQDLKVKNKNAKPPRWVRASVCPTLLALTGGVGDSARQAAAEVRGARPASPLRARPWGWSSGQNVFYSCKQ